MSPETALHGVTFLCSLVKDGVREPRLVFMAVDAPDGPGAGLSLESLPEFTGQHSVGNPCEALAVCSSV